MWLRGHSRSLKLVPFESLGVVSYSPSIVTMAVSVAVCEIFRALVTALPCYGVLEIVVFD